MKRFVKFVVEKYQEYLSQYPEVLYSIEYQDDEGVYYNTVRLLDNTIPQSETHLQKELSALQNVEDIRVRFFKNRKNPTQYFAEYHSNESCYNIQQPVAPMPYQEENTPYFPAPISRGLGNADIIEMESRIKQKIDLENKEKENRQKDEKIKQLTEELSKTIDDCDKLEEEKEKLKEQILKMEAEKDSKKYEKLNQIVGALGEGLLGTLIGGEKGTEGGGLEGFTTNPITAEIVGLLQNLNDEELSHIRNNINNYIQKNYQPQNI